MPISKQQYEYAKLRAIDYLENTKKMKYNMCSN